MQKHTFEACDEESQLATSQFHTTSNSGENSNMERILKENSTDKFFIQHGGYRFNHVSHGIIALDKMGASVEKLEKFVRYIEPILEPVERHKDQYKQANVDDLLGKRESYYCLVTHYEQLLQEKYEGSLDQFVGKEFPKLSVGLIGAALHGLIQIGYGHLARSPRVVCEGLAFLHYSSVPLVLSNPQTASFLGQGTLEAVDVINKLRDDEALYQFMTESEKSNAELAEKNGHFGTCVYPLVTQRGDELSQYVRQLQFPKSLDLKSRKIEDLKSLAKWALDCAVVVYTAAENRNDFFLLHGITGAWALYKIIDTVTDFDAGLNTIHTFLCALLATYLAVGKPELHLEYLDPKSDLTWRELVDQTLESERDVHIYKLVHVCSEMAKQDKQMDNTYRLASQCALSNKLYHRFFREGKIKRREVSRIDAFL